MLPKYRVILIIVKWNSLETNFGEISCYMQGSLKVILNRVNQYKEESCFYVQEYHNIYCLDATLKNRAFKTVELF